MQLFEGSEAEVFVASAEDTILSKLLWYQESESNRDFNDVVGMYLIQLAALAQSFLAERADKLGITYLLEQVKQEAERYSPPTR